MRELARRLEGLQAEESMRLATAVGVGTGAMRLADREDAIADWRAAARRMGGRGPLLTREQRIAFATAAGIRVVTE
jgi:hypothetical protein